LAALETLLPAQALLLQRGALRLRPDELVRVTGAVGLAEGVAAGDQRNGLLVVHRHPAERLADVAGRGQRVRVRVRAFRVDVDQAHLDRGQRAFQLPVAGVAVVAQPGLLRAPVDVLVRLPDIGAATGEAEGLKAHRVQRDVAGEHDQVGPGQALAVLLLDRPEQPAGLVQVSVVRPAVDRREPLHAGTGPAPAVVDPVGAGAVPGHPDEQAAVVAVVGRPPVLRIGQQLLDVGPDRSQVQAVEGCLVVEAGIHRVGRRGVLAQDLQVQLVRPPVTVAAALDRVGPPTLDDRAPGLVAGLWLVHLPDYGVGVLGHANPLLNSFRTWGSTVRAPAPVDDLGLVDREASVVRRGQAGRVTDSAVDIGDRPAVAAYHVVVVVPHPRLIACH